MTPDPLSTIREAIAQAQKLRAEATPGDWSPWNGWTGADGLTRAERIGHADVGWPGLCGSDIVGPKADFEFVCHARNTDPWAALEIAVKALEKATENAPTFRDYSGTDYHTCAWCREPAELPNHRHLAGCQWLGLRHALVEMARALAPEVTK